MIIDSSLLKEIVTTYGPSSREEMIRSLIANEIKEYVHEIKIDALGNLIAHKKGLGKKIMISSHMDQIGLMAIDIDEKGFIRFTNIGGIKPALLLGQRVRFENGTIGVVYSEKLEEDNKIKVDNLYIDIGTNGREETLNKVKIGDICIFQNEFLESDKVIISPYLDDRIGCYILIETIKNVMKNSNDLYFVFSVQEEVGMRGAKTAAFSIEPDIGLAVDVTSTFDTPKSEKLNVKLFNGAAIKAMDYSLIAHKDIKDALIELAEAKGIKYQIEVLEHGGTDAGAIHMSKSGVKTGAISIPCRYIHSQSEMVSKDDIIMCLELLKAYVE
ncbi:M42 family metallopeptidase [Soehngenia saccharolytica]|nr:M42 family metallopeptidase [Soehngenia saccharolytica]